MELINTPDLAKPLEVEIGTYKPELLPRLFKLYNDWNVGQMNLISRPMNEEQIETHLTQGGIKFFTFRPLNMGDPRVMGYVTVVIVNRPIIHKIVCIIDFLLSCRVWHKYRGMEELMLKTVVDYARSVGVEKVGATYDPIPYTDIMSKNEPALTFLKRSGFREEVKDKTFVWDTKDEYPQPEGVVVKDA